MTTTLPEAPPEVRSRLAVALDVDDLVLAERLCKELSPWFGVAKVGLELYSAAGPDAIAGLADLGMEVFADLKLHDIPTTVGKAAKVVGGLGARYLNFHAQGGVAMLTAGVQGFLEGAAEAGSESPVPLAVTVLTSDGDAPPHILGKRVQAALEAGCRGVVCAASDVPEVHQLAPRFVTMVPGIRPAGSATHDQARIATPGSAISAGAGVLVVGRAVTHAEDRASAAAAVAAEVAAALGGG